MLKRIYCLKIDIAMILLFFLLFLLCLNYLLIVKTTALKMHK